MYIYMAIEICADVACEGCYITYIYIVSAAQHCTGYLCVCIFIMYNW